MGEYVWKDTISSDKHRWGPNSPKPEKLFLQLIPGTVTDVVMNDTDAFYDGPSSINTITAKPHFGSSTGTKEAETTRYYPLFRGVTDTPVKGDAVLLLSNTGGENYYLGPLNALNNPNYNIDPLNRRINLSHDSSKTNERDKMNIPKNFKLANVARLQKPYNESLENRRNTRVGEVNSIARRETYGDLLLEGRYGNSIRIGHRDNTPNIFISNGRNGVSPIESLYDGSIISLTSVGSLKKHFHTFSLSSDVVENQTRLVGGGNVDENQAKFNYDWGDDTDGTPILRNHIFMSSDKITFNSRIDNITLSSYNNIDFGAGNNFTINTKNFTSIESSNIYLGKQAQSEKEPLVLGEQLKLFLEEILSILEIFKVSGVIAGISGPPSPDVMSKIKDMKSKLESATFLSEYHYIEDNGQKAD